MNKKYTSFTEFYPYYLSQHQNKTCRLLHVLGSTLVLLVAFYALLTSTYLFIDILTNTKEGILPGQSIAILPFSNAGTEEDEGYLVEGIAHAILVVFHYQQIHNQIQVEDRTWNTLCLLFADLLTLDNLKRS